MIPLTAEQIADITAGRLVAGRGDRLAQGVTIDSRTLVEADCFIAIIGPRDDGHRYLQQALAEGASTLVIQRAEIVDRLVNPRDAGIIVVDDGTEALQALARAVRDRVDPVVVAITGSVGKTTTKALTHSLLEDSRPTHVTPGNYNNQWGLPLSLLGLEPGHRWMIAELGMSAPGEIRALARLARPSIGVITNVAPAHMENFDSLDDVAAAKRELAEEVPDEGTLIVGADDDRTARIGREMAGRVDRVITFGTDPEATVGAEELLRTASGWELQLRVPGEPLTPVRLPLPGEHSVINFLSAAAVAHALAVSAADIAARAPDLELPDMRGQIHRTAAGYWVFDDSYNASPTAMMRALDTLSELPGEGRSILAAGDMLELGSWSEEAHREVGLHAAQLGIDRVFTVGPLARDIGHGAREGGLAAGAIRSFSTSEEAAEAVAAEVAPGDRVLVKGSRAVRMERVTRALLTAAAEEEEVEA